MPDDSMPADDLDLGIAAGFGRVRPRSALASIVPGAPRILLREPESDAPSPVLKPVAPGQEGRYQVLGEIARGAVGVVFKGHDVDLGRAVAIKVLRSEHSGNAGVVQRFVEEAQVGGQLQHPGIVPVYEMGVRADGRTPWFAMKLVKGRTLSALLAERRSPADERRRFLGVFEQVCQTVAYAHSRGVVHRDLKPANVMVGAFGEVQVVDWGFAKVLSRDEDALETVLPSPERSVIATVRSGSTDSHSVVGSVFGTPAYMPPEQARGSVDDVDERSDVFALGAMLCEILTGKPAYAGDPDRLVMMAAQADLAPANTRLAACGADPQILALCRACLVPAKEARLRSAGEVAAGVAGYLASEEEKTRTAQLAAVESKAAAAQARADAQSAHERAEHARRQRRLTVAVAAAVLVTFAVTGGAWVWLEHDRAERAADISRDVDAALGQSTFLRGRAIGRADAAAAHDALDAAKRAIDIASTRHAGADVRARAVEGFAETQAQSNRANKVANLLRRAGRLSSADGDGWIAVLRKAVTLYPECGEAHHQLAVGLHRRRTLDPETWNDDGAEIEAEFRKAIELDPDSTQTRFDLIQFIAAGYPDPEAQAEQDEALIRLEPSEPAWLVVAFDHCVQRGELDEADRIAQAAAALDPDEAPLGLRLAQLREALAVADAVVGGRPMPDAWKSKPCDVLDACLFARRYATIARLGTAHELAPAGLSSSSVLCRAALRFGALRAGFGEGTDQGDVSDEERTQFRSLSLAEYKAATSSVRGQYLTAADVASAPWCSQAWRLEGGPSGSIPDCPGGYTRAELTAKLPPEERAAWHDALIDYDRFGRGRSALDHVTFDTVCTPGSPNPLDTLETAEKASMRHPEDVGLLNTLGAARYRAGAYQEAIETLKRVEAAFATAGLGPRPSILAFLAMAYAKDGRTEEARATLARFRDVAAQGRWAGRADVRDLLRQATELIEGAAAAPREDAR
jgi:tetratricopeptide (TPR) repeat protein